MPLIDPTPAPALPAHVGELLEALETERRRADVAERERDAARALIVMLGINAQLARNEHPTLARIADWCRRAEAGEGINS